MGKVLWITGLSGAGKTTLARQIKNKLEQAGIKPIFLDGDELRSIFKKADSPEHYCLANRRQLAMQYSRLCKALADQGHTVIIATISLFHEIHEWNRAHIDCYTEVFIDAPLAELMRRDPKGIYSQKSDIVGIDVPCEYPKAPDFTLTQQTFDLRVDEIVASLIGKGGR